MVLVHVHHFPNKQTKPPTGNLPKRNQPSHAQFSQAKYVGEVPACPPERPRSGVSIPKIHALCAGNLTTNAPLQGDAGGHTGTAPTHLRYTSAYNPPQRYQPPKRNAETIHTHIGGGNASRTPAPITQNKKVCVCYDFGVTVDDTICFKTSYSLDVPRITPFALKQIILSVSRG